MIEMHLGTKPAKPTRLLLTSAGLLGLALVLAQAQSYLRMRSTVALSEQTIAISGTPLSVRLPRNAIAENSRNQSFLLPLENAAPGRGGEVVGRRIRFFFERRRAYVSPEQLAHDLGQVGSSYIELPDPVQIGPLRGVDFMRIVRGEGRGEIVVLRLACSPRGEVVGVEFTPLSEWTHAEQSVLDAICNTIQIEGITGSTDPGSLQNRAGLIFPLEPGWRLDGPEIAEAPGLYVSDLRSQSGWALGAVRTWLADDAAAPAAMRDQAALIWTGAPITPQAARRLKNGVDFYWCSRVGEESPGELSGLGLCVASPLRAAWMMGSGDPTKCRTAAEAIASTLEFGTVPMFDDLKSAETSADDFVRELNEDGAKPWWRAAPQTRYMLIRSGSNSGGGIRNRDAFGDGSSGYRGIEAFAFDDNPARRLLEWQVSGMAYDLELTHEFESQSGNMRTTIRDSRRTNESHVQRVAGLGRRAVQETIPVGSRFVPTPLEPLAALSVALREHAALLIEVLSLDQPRGYARLLRHLPQDAAGNRRVLCLDEVEPWGKVFAFDGSNECVYQHSASLWMDVVSRDRAEATSPALRDLLRRQGLPGL